MKTNVIYSHLSFDRVEPIYSNLSKKMLEKYYPYSRVVTNANGKSTVYFPNQINCHFEFGGVNMVQDISMQVRQIYGRERNTIQLVQKVDELINHGKLYLFFYEEQKFLQLCMDEENE